MRNALIRKILGFVGCALSGAVIGHLFSFAIAALSLKLFLTFIMFLLGAIFAAIAVWKTIIPAISTWVAAGETSTTLIDPREIIKDLQAHLFSKNAK